MARFIDNTAKHAAKNKLAHLKQTKTIKEFIEEVELLNDDARYKEYTLQDIIDKGLKEPIHNA